MIDGIYTIENMSVQKKINLHKMNAISNEIMELEEKKKLLEKEIKNLEYQYYDLYNKNSLIDDNINNFEDIEENNEQIS